MGSNSLNRRPSAVIFRTLYSCVISHTDAIFFALSFVKLFDVVDLLVSVALGFMELEIFFLEINNC